MTVYFTKMMMINNNRIFLGDEIPRVAYSKDENETWGTVYRQLKELYPLHACEQFNSILPLMERYCGYSEEGIPQLEDISQV